MAEGGRSPLYLARASYRRRRLIDGQRLLPVVMFLLFLLPLVWGGIGTGRPVGAGAQSFVHIFVVWIVGIAIAAWIALRLAREDGPEGDAATVADDVMEDVAEQVTEPSDIGAEPAMDRADAGTSSAAPQTPSGRGT